MVIVFFISFVVRVILNNIFGVKCHFVARLFIGLVYNEVKDKQKWLSSLNYTSLGSLLNSENRMCQLAKQKSNKANLSNSRRRVILEKLKNHHKT